MQPHPGAPGRSRDGAQQASHAAPLGTRCDARLCASLDGQEPRNHGCTQGPTGVPPAHSDHKQIHKQTHIHVTNQNIDKEATLPASQHSTGSCSFGVAGYAASCCGGTP
jgi:hypothetical protein